MKSVLFAYNKSAAMNITDLVINNSQTLEMSVFLFFLFKGVDLHDCELYCFCVTF